MSEIATRFAELLERAHDKRARRLDVPNEGWVDALQRYYSDGALLFGSDEHEQWVVAITEAAPMLFILARQAITRGDDLTPDFGTDPGDSAALLKLRHCIDGRLPFPTPEAEEAGDYESAVENVGTMIAGLHAKLAAVERLADQWSKCASDGMLPAAAESIRSAIKAYDASQCIQSALRHNPGQSDSAPDEQADDGQGEQHDGGS
jgi:hypothetical protein